LVLWNCRSPIFRSNSPGAFVSSILASWARTSRAAACGSSSSSVFPCQSGTPTTPCAAAFMYTYRPASSLMNTAAGAFSMNRRRRSSLASARRLAACMAMPRPTMRAKSTASTTTR
jgi:hypothetical protein